MTLFLAVFLSFCGRFSIAAEERIEVGSFSELEAALTNPDNAGQTIYLTSDIETLGATVEAKAIAAGITVDGQGQFVIKGDGKKSFFLKGNQVQNLTIENFKQPFEIRYNIDSIVNSNFINNTASYGGAICNYMETMGTIKDSLFEGNTVTKDGGAIYNDAGIIDSIVNTSFINNTASYGGAIYNYKNYKGTIGTIKDSLFEGNTATSSGGAIYNDHGNIDSIVNTSFINNTTSFGGAIFNDFGTIGTIKDSLFEGNTVTRRGGAIYNFYGTIDSIVNTNFINNTAGDGGAINNFYGTIDSIVNTNFINNTAGNGGAIYNKEHTIGTITNSLFEGNTATDSGGAIFNVGSIDSIVNTSFINNTAGNGGAIYSNKDLQISAEGEGKESVFSGNKQSMTNEQGDIVSEISNAIIMDSAASLTLSATDGGKVKFDDGILGYGKEKISSDDFEKLKQEAVASGGTISQDEDEWTISVREEGYSVTYKFKDMGNGIYNEFERHEIGTMEKTLPADELLVEIEAMEQDGYPLNCNADKSHCTLNMKESNGAEFNCTFTQNADGSYLVQIFTSYNKVLPFPSLYITGDDSGKVEFNNEIKGFAAVDISGATTDFNNGVRTVKNVRIATGSAKVNTGATLKNVEVNAGGRLSVKEGGSVYRTAVNEGGKMSVTAGGYAEDTTVNNGGSLDAATEARLHNLLANGGAVLDIDSGAVLTGNIILDAAAELGGSYDYGKIFKDEVSEEGSLTLVGGLNNTFQENTLVNTTTDKRLNLTTGDYAIGDGAQAVVGWDKLTIKDNATVKLEGDIWMSGADKHINLMTGTELNLAGHSPSNYQIVGSLNNDGSINFSHAGDGADDVTTIFGNYKAYANAEITIDVDPISNTADKLVIQGDVEGTTKVVINPLNNNEATDKILFVSAPNDLADTAAHFDIYRVIGDAHQWNVLYADNNWYTATDNIISDSNNNGYGDNSTPPEDLDDETQNDAVLPPDMPNIPERPSDGNSGNNMSSSGGKAKVYGEAVAYAGLPAMGVEQTRDMLRHIASNVEHAKKYNNPCGGFYDYFYDRNPQESVWASPVYARSEVDAPVGFEADIWGLEGGFDVQKDAYNRLGMFLSYRHGKYDLDGSGKEFYADVESDVEIDSYVAGLYHRYDRGRIWAMTSLFGGWQDVEASTDDGVKADTDGYMFGGSVELGMAFAPEYDLIIEPTLRLAYTQINYDDMSDKYGKTAEYDTLHNVETEIGVKVEKILESDYGNESGKIYIKPSLIQNFGKGDVSITSLDEVAGLDDMTLGRVEAGGNINFAESWSAYASASYTFGDDYNNTSFNLGLRYSF